MTQNRNKLLDLLIGNLSNSIVHSILEKSYDLHKDKYKKESISSLQKSIIYRSKINPLNKPLPDTDIEYIKSKLKNKITSELLKRIALNYQNINLSLIDPEINSTLKKLNII